VATKLNPYLPRLSEDLDFDYLTSIDSTRLKDDLVDFFKIKQKFKDISSTIKQQGKQVLIKFHVLKKLGLALANESDLLHIKIDLSQSSSKHYEIQTTSKSKYGFNFVATHYDLSTLMAGKINAIFTRNRQTGQNNRATIKGRDYFDLLWFVKNSVKPNLKWLTDTLNKDVTFQMIKSDLDQKVKELTTKYKTDFETDLESLISNPDIIEQYVANYFDEYNRYKLQSFSTSVNLKIKCKHCNKEFHTGILLSPETFENITIQGNGHKCPHCNFMNSVNKNDYIF